MKTLLVYPPFHRLHRLKNRFFPIGLGYLAGALRTANQEVAIYNAENYDDGEPLLEGRNHSETFKAFDYYQDALDDPSHYVWREVSDVIAGYQPDVVGVTTKSCMIPAAQMISRIAKEVNPGVTVIWGGPHASICPDETIGFDNVDFVARHEGEKTVVEFIEMLESGAAKWSSIDGLVWRDDSRKVVHNKIRANMGDINDMFPDKSTDLFPERYEPDHYGVMFTSRGCPWPCTFCDSRGVWTRRIRLLTPENIAREMRQLYDELGVRDFYFWDDTFTPYRKHSVKVFKRDDPRVQREKGQPITWQATTRCDCVDDDLAALMKESGCRLLTYGVETGSPSMMAILKKGITHDKVFHAQEVMRKAGITWDAFFMIGFPDDTPEAMEETMALIRKLECRSVAISIFTPYPGLEIYERAKAYGLINKPIEWRFFSHQSPRNHFVKNIAREEFHQIAENCLTEIDRLNSRRYRMDRLRHYASHPQAIPEKLWSMAKHRIQSRAKPLPTRTHRSADTGSAGPS